MLHCQYRFIITSRIEGCMRRDFCWLESGGWRVLSTCTSLTKIKTSTQVDASKPRYEETLDY